MSTDSEKYRSAMKSKAERMVTADPHQKVDGSDWTPAEAMENTAQTGMRVLSRDKYKKGGRVQGGAVAMHAGRKPRAKGGGVVDDFFNVDQKKANQLRDGVKHQGGLATGGRAGKFYGGAMMRPEMQRPGMATPMAGARPMPMMRASGGKVHADAAEDKKLINSEMHKAGCKCAMCHGGRAEKASGGSTKNMSRKQRDAAKYLRPDMGFHEQLKGIRAAADPKNTGVTPTAFQRAQGVADYLEKNQSKFIGRTADRDPEHFQGAGIKRGGVARKQGGSVALEGGTRPTGGRMPRKSGGRTKKGTTVNVIIAGGMGKPAMPPAMPMPPPGAGPVGLHQAPPPVAAPAPMGPPATGAPPPMMRKRGGRTGYPIESGAGGGLGRLEKIKAYG